MRGTIRKRGDGFEIAVSAGSDPVTGKRHRMYRWARTEREAERELTKLLSQVDSGAFADPGRLTVGSYLREHWLPHISTRVRSRTALRYRQLLELHVVPKIGAVKMAKLRPAHVQLVIDAMVAAGRAPRTTAQAYRTLHAALKQGVRWQLLGVNAAAAVQPPRAARVPLTVPDAETIGRILDVARGSRCYVPLVLAATTGMRRGEILGLRWGSVDLDAGLARVVTSLQHVEGELVFMSPKTDRGRRTVALPAAAIAVLRRHRKDQTARRLLLGEAWTDLDLVMDQGDGQPMSPDGLSRAFYRLTHDRIGLPGLRLHDLRHGYATALLVAGVHPKVVSEALGHSSVAFTLDVYSHILPSMQDRTGAAIEAALGAAITGGTVAAQPAPGGSS